VVGSSQTMKSGLMTARAMQMALAPPTGELGVLDAVGRIEPH
jgi:hypothetical protein